MNAAGLAQATIQAAASRLAAGELLAFPTETVYGLGARADDDQAVARIYTTKGRPAHHPVIVHVATVEQARFFARDMPDVAQRLIQAFWPGPLTVIVPRRVGVAVAAAGGHDTVGLRCPRHPVAQSLLVAAVAQGVPGVAAPSANRFGRISPTCASHVLADLGPTVTVLDGGACAVGIESCIVDCSRGYPILLRPGTLTVAQLEAAAGQALQAPDTAVPRAPGTLASHYAPRTPLRLVGAAQLQAAVQATCGGGTPAQPSAEGALGAVAHWGPTGVLYLRSTQLVDAHSRDGLARAGWRVHPMSEDAAVAAQDLFADLRAFDALGVSSIWVEMPPDTPAWQGVRDRLQRAAA